MSEDVEKRSAEIGSGASEKHSSGQSSDSDSPPIRKRRVSIFKHFIKQKDDEEKRENYPKKKRRRSSVRDKLAYLERELTFDKVQSRFANMFADDDETENDGKEKIIPMKRELSSGMAAIFIVSATTGFAMRNLPYALKESSWFGVFLIILLCVNLSYAGLCNGWSWVIMEERWPEYQGDSRIPYQDMAEKAIGKWMKYIVAVCVDLTLLAVGAVYILSAGDFIETFAHRYINFCPAVIITSLLLTPLIWFRSYKDIKFIGILDVLLSVLWVLLLVVGLLLHKESRVQKTYTNPSYESVALAFAYVSFAYGGGATYPSIMVDMKDRGLFPQASTTACLIVLMLYALPSILGYAAYGDDTPLVITQKLIEDAELHSFGVVIEIVLIIQLMSTFVVALMPTMQAFEHRFGCPKEFGMKRVLVRSSLIIVLLLVVLGVPTLPKFVGFIGATTMTFLTFVFPPLFYVCLVYRQEADFKNKRKVSKKEWLLVGEMIILGIVVCIVSTYVTVKEAIYSPEEGRTPCYLNFSAMNPRVLV